MISLRYREMDNNVHMAVRDVRDFLYILFFIFDVTLHHATACIITNVISHKMLHKIESIKVGLSDVWDNLIPQGQ